MTREEAIKVLSESIHDGSKVPWDKIVEAVHLSIEALSQPFPPSNLDEAAHEFEDKAMSDYDDIVVTEDGVERPVLKYNFTDAFKAGAEWMAEQGETHEAEIIESVPFGGTKWQRCIKVWLDDQFQAKGDKVVVQIRKKQSQGAEEK